MKWISSMFLMTVLLLTGAPATYALQAAPSVGEKVKDKKRQRLPEGSGTVILVLAAGAVGGGLLIWRRKRLPAA